MKKTVLLVVVIAFVGAVGWITYTRVIAPARTADEVVLRSFNCLRNADFSALRNCYTETAWAIVEQSLPDPANSKAIALLKEYMSGVLDVRIEATTYRGERAEVELLIERHDESEREVLQLKKSGRTWLID